jgi:hypothetical protein
MMSTFSPFTNPFTRSPFWGREKELSIIWGRLLNTPPQSIVIIGEPRIGKSRLLKQLMQSTLVDADHFTFVYHDCKRYIQLIEDWTPKTQVDKEQSVEQKREGDISNFASARFWWDLYITLRGRLQEDESFPEPRRNQDDASLLDSAYEISFAIEKWVRSLSQSVIFILDNFEGVARLPLRNSDRLRSLGDNCGFILTSRYALYVLYNYHKASWEQPSPFYNIFSDPIYLGLLSEQEVSRYLEWAVQEAKKAGSDLNAQDSAFIRKIAGRHPELLRMACARMFEERCLSPSFSETEDDKQDNTFLALRIIRDGRELCKQLWEGLANPELYGLVSSPGAAKKEDSAVLSPYQLTLIDIAHERPVTDTQILFGLEQRGLIERVSASLRPPNGGDFEGSSYDVQTGRKENEEWRIFSEVMQQFVLMQEELLNQAHTGTPGIAATSLPDTPAGRDDERTLTYREGKVYDYLKTHLGEVCDKTEIMQAVWGGGSMPTNSALQKIIERIREKIEDDPESPYKLIAVRGRGYMLRKAL